MKFLVTPALPYANGPLHLGHMVEFVLADTFVRYQRSAGHEVVFVCADDTHGTPIELYAAKQGLTPEAMVARMWESHRADLRDFGISLDTFHSTNSPENKHYSELIYGRLKEAGDILRRTIRQTYCEVDRRFLPDRFVRGTCPNCKSPDQYGDACEVCGKTYRPEELIGPRCAICGTPPVTRESEHLFFALSKHQAWLQDVVRSPGFLHPAVANQLQAFFDQGLQDWDISRDAPYFGFPIPGEKDKFFYVWLDAPIGYVSATEKWAKDTGRARSAMDIWAQGSDTEIRHFIGKDIVYFHALFWPTVLEVARFKRPARLHVHGHLTLNGEKMSKSRGTLIDARTALDGVRPGLPPLLLRREPGARARGLRPVAARFPLPGERRAGEQRGQPREPDAVAAGGPARGDARPGARPGGEGSARGGAGPNPGGGGVATSRSTSGRWCGRWSRSRSRPTSSSRRGPRGRS